MSQPLVYNRQSNFSNFQARNPSTPPPGNQLDAEFNAVKTTLDAILANLKIIQRDDTALANGSVGAQQISAALNIGFTAPTAWQPGVQYITSPASTVFNAGKFYVCQVSNTSSSSFANDLAAGDWLLIADFTTIPIGTASQVSVTSDSALVTSDVQTSLNALDAGKAPTSHTHTSAQISDSTTVGRSLLTAATLTAVDNILGLGSFAFLSALPLTLNPIGAAFKNLIVGNVAGPQGFTAPATPNVQYRVTADAIVLADGSGNALNVQGLNVTADLSVSGVNGLDANTVTANTNYFLWVIGTPGGSTISGLWSLSATAPTLPAGYTFKARVSWGRTNASSQLARVLQQGRRAQYVVSASVTTALPIIASGTSGNIATPTWTPFAIASFVPSTASVIRCVLGAAAAGAMVAPNANYGASTSTSNPPPLVASAGNEVGDISLESGNVFYASGVASGVLACLGWEDNI